MMTDNATAPVSFAVSMMDISKKKCSFRISGKAKRKKE